MLLASCQSKQQNSSNDIAALYPAPKQIAVNTKEGYIINPLTGDSIQPIINSLGDTIKTGVPVRAEGKAIHPDSLELPKTIPSGHPKVIFTHLNQYKIPDALNAISVDINSLETFIPGVDSSSNVTVNLIKSGFFR